MGEFVPALVTLFGNLSSENMNNQKINMASVHYSILCAINYSVKNKKLFNYII